ncbi:MAG: DUF342 domain-containing protein [Candidatus Cloacimonetes bacterium]|nr:DUF342 domain-containing protein [Candidatus Cloacimonadota bacterium]
MMEGDKTYTNDNGNLILEISEDGILANLIIRNTGDVIDEKEIVDLLRKANIRNGFERAMDFLRNNEIRKSFNEPFVVALSMDPEHQVKINYLIDEARMFNPREFKSISDLEKYISIEKEQPLAEFSFTDMDQNSKDVFGNEIKPAINKNQIIHNYLGENVYYSVYKKQIMSSKAGYPFLDDNRRINVKSEFKMNRDLHGKQINMMGNLTVNGDMSECELFLDGNLKVEGKIWNCNRGSIIVTGNIEINNAENSNFICRGKLKFEKSLRFCNIAVEKSIQGTEESSIIGGLVRSGESIEAGNIGSPFVMMTDLEIAVSPFTKELISYYNEQIKALKKKYTQNAARIKILLDRISKLQEEYEEKLHHYLKGEIRGNFIKASKKAFPEIHLRIFEKNRNISRELNSFNCILSDKKLEINEG